MKKQATKAPKKAVAKKAVRKKAAKKKTSSKAVTKKAAKAKNAPSPAAGQPAQQPELISSRPQAGSLRGSVLPGHADDLKRFRASPVPHLGCRHVVSHRDSWQQGP